MQLASASAGPLELFNSSRLASRPYCTDDPTQGLHIRGPEQALRHRHIQVNSPFQIFRIVLDVDHDVRVTAAMDYWYQDFDVPAPNWYALDPAKGTAHVGYELEVPVARHDFARRAPMRFANAIGNALTRLLRADQGYGGLLCKNPHSPVWDVGQCHLQPYSLAELGSELDLKKYGSKLRVRDVESWAGRNVLLFDRLRYWAYAHIGEYAQLGRGAWDKAVYNQACGGFNVFDGLPFERTDPLQRSELRALARSVSKWVWDNFDSAKSDADFRSRQKHLASLSALAKHRKREPVVRLAIAEIIAAGRIPTYRSVATRVGCSASTLAECYSDLFAAPLQ